MRNIRRPRSARCARPLSLLRDENGSTAIEFGLIALPFLLFVLAIVGMGLYFLASVSLEHGAQAAARKIRALPSIARSSASSFNRRRRGAS